MYSLTPSLISSKYNSSNLPTRIATPFAVVHPCTGVQSAQAGIYILSPQELTKLLTQTHNIAAALKGRLIGS